MARRIQSSPFWIDAGSRLRHTWGKQRMEPARAPLPNAILAVGCCPEDTATLGRLCAAMDWRLHFATGYMDAMEVLCRFRVRAILCASPRWMDILGQTLILIDPPALILLARDPDAASLAEARRMGAVGVLPIPLDQQDALQVLIAACQGAEKVPRLARAG